MLFRVVVKDDQAAPVNDALVLVYDYDPAVLGAVEAQAQTDADGVVDFDVDAGTYAVTVRGPDAGYRSPGVSQITVAEAGDIYDLVLSSSSVGVPADVGLCRVYLELRDLAGRVRVTNSFRFSALESYASGAKWHGLGSEWFSHVSGRVWADLPRGISGYLSGATPEPVALSIPDASTASLLGLLVHAAESVALDETELEMSAEDVEVVGATVAHFGAWTPPSWADAIAATSSAPGVATVVLTDAGVSVTAVAAGTAVITVTRRVLKTVPGLVLRAMTPTTIAVTVT